MLYNSLTRTKEAFEPMAGPKVSFYSCGPTVYDYAHIGNFRAFLTYDVLKRWLTYCGYEVDHVCNLTDIDDKITLKMAEEGKSLEEVTNHYVDAFFEDLEVLNIVKARAYPRATEHVRDIEAMVAKLVRKGFAYENAGSVYFRVQASVGYGALANRDFNKDEVGAGGYGPNARRGSSDKENERDFVLWKNCGADEVVGYDSQFGYGRPGWHIECSAMIDKLLGETIDVHAGGVDLVFPHHQNEIAQSEAASGKPFCKYWVHNGFVNINSKKMSKSLKNFKTLRDIASTPNDARAFRFMVVSAQYRGPLNFTPETLKAAISSLKRIDRAVTRLSEVAGGSMLEGDAPATEVAAAAAVDIGVKGQAIHALQQFDVAMRDDMNTPRAVAALFELVAHVEKAAKAGTLTAPRAKTALEAIRQMDRVFGVLYDVPRAYFPEHVGVGADQGPITQGELPPDVAQLAATRAAAKQDKDWAAADLAREQLALLGYRVKDGKDGAYDLLRV